MTRPAPIRCCPTPRRRVARVSRIPSRKGLRITSTTRNECCILPRTRVARPWAWAAATSIPSRESTITRRDTIGPRTAARYRSRSISRVRSPWFTSQIRTQSCTRTFALTIATSSRFIGTGTSQSTTPTSSWVTTAETEPARASPLADASATRPSPRLASSGKCPKASTRSCPGSPSARTTPRRTIRGRTPPGCRRTASRPTSPGRRARSTLTRCSR
mmetsp:Transcript_47053/g.100016  ORF Transcript_47053/g.100016 Transcript_47053/m.100016 type:complete len:217 (+) Transcript_47053:2599-3249(+)